MKLIALKLCNLASITGEQEIRFDIEPLKSTGLIAITGRTGAGKSTILDGLCLALYGEIPRFQHQHSAKIQDYSGASLTVTDVRHILRRGTGQGFAEVEFIALDGQHYRSSWKVRRAYKKATNDFQNTECVVQCVTDGRILTQNKTEHRALIPRLIGLSFAQFTRAVLLAQSDVGAFLKANDSERASLLEYLTNSSIFSVIGQLAYEKNKYYDDQYKKQQALLSHMKRLSDEQRQHLLDKQQEILQQISTIKQQLTLLTEQQQLHQNYQKLCAELQQKEQQYQQLILQEPKIQQVQQQLNDWYAMVEIRATIKLYLEGLQAEQQQRSQLQQLEQQQQQQSEQTQQLEQQYQQAKANWQTQQQRLQVCLPPLEQAMQFEVQWRNLRLQYQQLKQKTEQWQEQEIVPLTQQQQQLAQHIQQLEQVIQQRQQQLSQSQAFAVFDDEPKAVIQQLEHIHSAYLDLQQQLQQQQIESFSAFSAQGQTLTHQYQQFEQQFGRVEQLTQTVQQALQQYHQCEKQRYSVEQLLELVQRYQQTQQQQQQQQEQQQQLIMQQQQAIDDEQLAKQQYQHCEQRLSDVVQILQQQRLIHSQNVQQLREQLQPQQPCMVCGSVEHPFIEQHQTFNDSLLQLQQQQEQHVKQQREQALQDWLQRQQHCTTLQQQISHLAETQHSTQQTLNQLEQQLLTTLSTMTWIEHSRTSIPQDTDVQIWLQQAEQAEQTAQQHHQQSEQQLHDYQSLIQQYEQWQGLNQQYQALQQRQESIFSKLEPIWQQRWQDDVLSSLAQVRQQIEQRQENRLQLKAEQDTLTTQQYELKHQAQQLEHAQKQGQKLQQEQQDVIEQGKSAKQQMIDILNCHHLSEHLSANTAKQHLQQQYEHALTAYQHAQDEKYQHEQSQQQCQLQLTEWQVRLQQTQQQSQHAEREIQHWQAQYPHLKQDDVLATLEQSPQTMIDTLTQQVEAYQQQKISLTGAIQSLEQHKQHYQIDDSQSLVELNAQIEHQQQQLNDLEHQERSYHVQLEQDKQQEQDYQQYEQHLHDLQADYYRWNKIYSVIGSQKGDKFQRIAQQYYLDILLEYANLQLQSLAPRYELQRIEQSLSLAIKDHDMNDELRTVLSLSGGESFLVSLALALAIAHMASGSIKLDTLFIDEGFGTLDQQSLHIVMDSLDRLQSQGRKVILISHIQEIHERIPVQIQVKTQGAGSSCIEIVG